ncbi:hypothetical protein KR009_005025, partial [Drosophila setifemur]
NSPKKYFNKIDFFSGRKRQKERYLRKKLHPKSPQKAINELKGVHIRNFSVRNNGVKFIAKAVINAKEYSAEGESKKVATNQLFENALREYYVAVSSPKQEKSQNELESMEEFPMRNLVSLALYKLFADWSSKGYDIPQIYTSTTKKETDASDVGPEEDKLELPDNWSDLHPVTLLNYFCPDLQMQEECMSSPDGNTHYMSVSIDGILFNANGPTMKSAKRLLAIQACNELFGTTYEQ